MERLTKRVGNTVDFANGKANLKEKARYSYTRLVGDVCIRRGKNERD